MGLGRWGNLSCSELLVDVEISVISFEAVCNLARCLLNTFVAIPSVRVNYCYDGG